jgi:hypothetical protein
MTFPAFRPAIIGRRERAQPPRKFTNGCPRVLAASPMEVALRTTELGVSANPPILRSGANPTMKWIFRETKLFEKKFLLLIS